MRANIATIPPLVHIATWLALMCAGCPQRPTEPKAAAPEAAAAAPESASGTPAPAAGGAASAEGRPPGGAARAAAQLDDGEPIVTHAYQRDPLTARPPGRFIDAHVHLAGLDIWGEVSGFLDENGIDYAFNLSGGSPRRGATLAVWLQRASGGRIVNFMNVDWEGIDEETFGAAAAAELEVMVRQFGYGGLKIAKGLGLGVRDGYGALIPVDDPRLFPLWAKAGELGVPVFIHTADPAAFWLPVTPENERYAELSLHPSWSFAGPEFPPRLELLRQLERVFAAFPQTRFVSVHMGNNAEDLDDVARVLRTYPNVYVDIAARVPEFGRHPADKVRAFFVEFQDRILFATDLQFSSRRGRSAYTLGSGGAEPNTRDEVGPFYAAHRQYFETNERQIVHPTPIQGDWRVDAIGLPADVLDKVYYLNAHRLVLQRRP